MSAFKPLPFQYLQRAAEYIKAHPNEQQQFMEQRDQDLENYLANLHGGARVSLGIFTGSPTIITSGDPTQVLPLTFAAGIGGYANYATDGLIMADGTQFDPFTDLVAAAVFYQANWNSTGSTTPGFAQTLCAGDSRLILPSLTGDVSFVQQTTIINAFAGPASGDYGVPVQLSDVITDLQTSTGPLGGITELQSVGLAIIYIVE